MPTLPNVKTFLIADQVFPQASGKWCVIGVFDRIVAARFPVVHPSLGLFLTISDAEGDYEVKVEFRNEESKVLAEFGGIRLTAPHRLATVPFGVQTDNLKLPAPGRYSFVPYFNGEPVVTGDIHLEAVHLEQGKRRE